MAFQRALAALTLASALSPLQASPSSIARVAPADHAPRISIQQLRSALSSNLSTDEIDLHRILHDSHGILRVAVDGGFPALRKRALRHLCECPAFDGAFEDALQSHPTDLQQLTLPDGSVRRTLASATVGFERENQHALELPSWVQDGCGNDAYDAFEDMRDVVADVADAFVDRLDREKSGGGGISGKGVDEDRSYRQILSGANHLEHFHVYTKTRTSPGVSEEGHNREGVFANNSGKEEETATFDYHTDAGFFLSFVPAMNCHSYTTDNDSFYLKGQEEPVSFGDDEVIIMMGAGAQYWLHPRQYDGATKSNSFLAASHALRLPHDTHRAWYGKMHLMPSSMTAIIEPSPTSPMKYGEALPAFDLNKHGAHVPSSTVDGCGTIAFNGDSLPTLSAGHTVSRRRRLQHASSPAVCNNQTNFFCWHQCIDIPDAEQAEGYVQDGYSLYCLDPSVLSEEHSIGEATGPCQGGYAHNSNCVGIWHETDKSVPGYKLPYEVKEKGHNHSATSPMPMGDAYCYGGTSMYMDGFNWQGTTCVIYLFQSWVLSTPGKFALAALGSILFGIALEFVLWKRRSVYALPAGVRRLGLSALVYGVQLTMGYFIMLVIMTYSAPLFISTVGGMMMGHVLFNAQDSVVKHRMEKKSRVDTGEVTETARLESCSDRRQTDTNTELSSYQHSNGGDIDQVENGCGCESTKPPPEEETVNESSSLRAVADGVTPCCQYTL